MGWLEPPACQQLVCIAPNDGLSSSVRIDQHCAAQGRMMLRRGAAMESNQLDKIGELATDLDDLTLTVEELQADLPPGRNADRLEQVRESLEKASDTTDEVITDDSD